MEKSNQVWQDNTNLSIYDSVREVPKEAKKEIEAGRLKGKHDINLYVKKDWEWSRYCQLQYQMGVMGVKNGTVLADDEGLPELASRSAQRSVVMM